MKKLEKLLLKACGYTVVTTVLFFFVAMMGEFTKAAIDFTTFLLIFVFGVIISSADLIFTIPALKKVFKVMIHYAVLLLAFFVVFLLAGKLGNAGSSVIFSAIIIFTFLYAAIFAIIYLIKITVKAADKLLDKSSKKQRVKAEYTPLYKNKD